MGVKTPFRASFADDPQAKNSKGSAAARKETKTMSSWSTSKAQGLAAANVNAAVSTAQVFPSAAVPTSPVYLPLPASGALDRRVFLVRATGYATTVAATTTVLISLYAVVGNVLPAAPVTVANYTLLAASTARVVNTTSCPWSIEAELVTDSVSGKLHGSAIAIVNNSIDNKAALSNVLTGLLPAGPDAFAIIVCAITFGVTAGNAGNIGNLNDFVLDS